MSTLIIKPKLLKYHRNGVSGIGFYALSFDWEELDKSRPEGGDDFIATFEVDDEDQHLRLESCRVVNPKDLMSCWRGDKFADAIQKKFVQLGYKYSRPMVYDLIQVINELGKKNI